MSFDVNEPFFIYVEFISEVIEDTNNLIAFSNPGFFFSKIASAFFQKLFHGECSS